MPERDYTQYLRELIAEKSDPETKPERVAEIDDIIAEIEKILGTLA